MLSEAIDTQAVTRARIAEAAEMSASQLSRALSGKKVFTLDQLDAVCSAIGADMIDVVTEADRRSSTRPRAQNVALRHDDYDLVANETIDEFPAGDDADYDQA